MLGDLSVGAGDGTLAVDSIQDQMADGTLDLLGVDLTQDQLEDIILELQPIVHQHMVQIGNTRHLPADHHPVLAQETKGLTQDLDGDQRRMVTIREHQEVVASDQVSVVGLASPSSMFG